MRRPTPPRAIPVERVDAPDDGEPKGEPEEAPPVRPTAEAASSAHPGSARQCGHRVLRARRAVAGACGRAGTARHRPAHHPVRAVDPVRDLRAGLRARPGTRRPRLRERDRLRVADERRLRRHRLLHASAHGTAHGARDGPDGRARDLEHDPLGRPRVAVRLRPRPARDPDRHALVDRWWARVRRADPPRVLPGDPGPHPAGGVRGPVVRGRGAHRSGEPGWSGCRDGPVRLVLELDPTLLGLASVFIDRAIVTIWLLGMAYAVLHYVVPRAA